MPIAPTSAPPVDHVSDRDALKDELLSVAGLSGYGAHFQVKEVLTEAGFEVRLVQKIWVHQIWETRLLRGTAVFPETAKEMEREFSRIFRANGMPIARDDITVGPNGDRINLAFTWRAGCTGILAVGKSGCATFQFAHLRRPRG